MLVMTEVYHQQHKNTLNDKIHSPWQQTAPPIESHSTRMLPRLLELHWEELTGTY